MSPMSFFSSLWEGGREAKVDQPSVDCASPHPPIRRSARRARASFAQPQTPRGPRHPTPSSLLRRQADDPNALLELGPLAVELALSLLERPLVLAEALGRRERPAEQGVLREGRGRRE